MTGTITVSPLLSAVDDPKGRQTDEVCRPLPVFRIASSGAPPLAAQILRHEIPIDDIPERLNIRGPRIAVIDVIGVFPHIESQDGRFAISNRAARIGRGFNGEVAAAVFRDPGPTRAELS